MKKKCRISGSNLDISTFIIIFCVLVFSTILLAANSVKNTTGKIAQREINLKLNSNPDNSQFYNKTIIVKFKNQRFEASNSNSLYSSSIVNLSQKHQVTSIKKIFPLLEKSVLKRVDILKGIYIVTYTSVESPVDVAAEFTRDTHIEYAEPKYLAKIYDIPNDSLYLSMPQFEQIEAPQAWEMHKGNKEIVIAIVDGGPDWRHEDLIENVWNNPGEIDNNGIDDDKNGYIDDIHGWNFASNSADPTGLDDAPHNKKHATHVAGIACGVTNNRTGLSSISWNCRFMPVNVAATIKDEIIQYGYEGIVYAVENGADIVNCSWGRDGPSSEFEQDVMDFAYANNVLVVCAAGNGGMDGRGDNNDERPQYPTNYNHVLSVGATNYIDELTSYSNYGITVDVFAPGDSILSTVPGNGYDFLSGTSMATPLVSGLAGLLKSSSPHLSVDELREQIRVSCDNIETKNPFHAGLLGRGRVNAYKTLTEKNLPSIRIVKVEYTNAAGDTIINRGDITDLKVYFTNYLAHARNIQFDLATDDRYVQLIKESDFLDGFQHQDTLSVTFQIKVPEFIRDGYVCNFSTNISTSHYFDRDVFHIVVNPPTFMTHDNGVLQTSITSQGNIGFIHFADDSPGQGFRFNGRNLLFEGGLMIGNGVRTVSDCIRGEDDEVQDDDFCLVSDEEFVIKSPGEQSTEEGILSLTDKMTFIPLGLIVKQHSYSFTELPYTDFVIFTYDIQNSGFITRDSLFVGLYIDYDINTSMSDYVQFDASRKMGIIRNKQINANALAAVKLLTPVTDMSFRAIHNPAELYDGFSDEEKWHFLSGGLQTLSVDSTDVSMLLSTGPFTLEPNDSRQVCFALLAGSSMDELLNSADATDELWNTALTVELRSFTACYEQNKVKLVWNTLSENSNYGFEVERSQDGKDFEVIGFVRGGGTQQNEQLYSYYDTDFPQDTLCYRLKQIDQNGTFVYFEPVKIYAGVPKSFKLYQNYPNPFNASTVFRYELPQKTTVSMTIFNIKGEKVRTLFNVKKDPGFYETRWDGTDETGKSVSSGIYFCSFKTDFFSDCKRILVLK